MTNAEVRVHVLVFRLHLLLLSELLDCIIVYCLYSALFSFSPSRRHTTPEETAGLL